MWFNWKNILLCDSTDLQDIPEESECGLEARESEENPEDHDS